MVPRHLPSSRLPHLPYVEVFCPINIRINSKKLLPCKSPSLEKLIYSLYKTPVPLLPFPSLLL